MVRAERSVGRAISDLEARTLAALPGDFARLVYIASTRDYNSGNYRHDGLAFAYGREIAGEALSVCHRRAFEQMLRLALPELVGALREYVQSLDTPAAEFLSTWRKLEPFSVLVPLDAHPVAAELFQSNVLTAVEVLWAEQPPLPGR